MDTPFEAYVTNLGKYNEGQTGEFLKFPTTTEEVQALLNASALMGCGMRKSLSPTTRGYAGAL